MKAEHPGLNPHEISRICYVRFGRRPARKSVKRVLAEEPVPLRFVRRFPPYHEIPKRRDGHRRLRYIEEQEQSPEAERGSGPARKFSNEAEVRHLRRLQREKKSELHGRRAQWVEFHSSSTTRTRPSEKHRIALDNRTYTR